MIGALHLGAAQGKGLMQVLQVRILAGKQLLEAMTRGPAESEGIYEEDPDWAVLVGCCAGFGRAAGLRGVVLYGAARGSEGGLFDA